MNGRNLFKPLTWFTALGYVFLYLPICVLIGFSFNTSRFSVVWEEFTWNWYVKLIEDPLILDALKNSIIVAIVATILSTIIGTLTAYGLYRYRFRGKSLFDGVLFLPIVTPEIVVGISLVIFFVLIHVNLGLTTIIIAHVAFDIPFVMLVVRARLQGMDRSLEEAAMDLGADELTTFFKVTIPQLLPGIIAAALLAFTLSFDDFVITFFVAGVGSTTLPLKIYSMVRLGVSPKINALSALIVLFSIILITISDRLQRKSV
jgi:ABC-type spermidine/putrescine transport system permease subunit II